MTQEAVNSGLGSGAANDSALRGFLAIVAGCSVQNYILNSDKSAQIVFTSPADAEKFAIFWSQTTGQVIRRNGSIIDIPANESKAIVSCCAVFFQSLYTNQNTIQQEITTQLEAARNRGWFAKQIINRFASWGWGYFERRTEAHWNNQNNAYNKILAGGYSLTPAEFASLQGGLIQTAIDDARAMLSEASLGTQLLQNLKQKRDALPFDSYERKNVESFMRMLFPDINSETVALEDVDTTDHAVQQLVIRPGTPQAVNIFTANLLKKCTVNTPVRGSPNNPAGMVEDDSQIYELRKQIWLAQLRGQLRSGAIDIMMLQEYDLNSENPALHREFLKLLQKYGYELVISPPGCALVVNTKKFEQIDTVDCTIQAKAGSNGIIDSYAERTLKVSILQDKNTKELYAVAPMHLAYDKDYSASLDLLRLELLKRGVDNIIFAGDTNAIPNFSTTVLEANWNVNTTISRAQYDYYVWQQLGSGVLIDSNAITDWCIKNCINSTYIIIPTGTGENYIAFYDLSKAIVDENTKEVTGYQGSIELVQVDSVEGQAAFAEWNAKRKQGEKQGRVLEHRFPAFDLMFKRNPRSQVMVDHRFIKQKDQNGREFIRRVAQANDGFCVAFSGAVSYALKQIKKVINPDPAVGRAVLAESQHSQEKLSRSGIPGKRAHELLATIDRTIGILMVMSGDASANTIIRALVYKAMKLASSCEWKDCGFPVEWRENDKSYNLQLAYAVLSASPRYKNIANFIKTNTTEIQQPETDYLQKAMALDAVVKHHNEQLDDATKMQLVPGYLTYFTTADSAVTPEECLGYKPIITGDLRAKDWRQQKQLQSQPFAPSWPPSAPPPAARGAAVGMQQPVVSPVGGQPPAVSPSPSTNALTE